MSSHTFILANINFKINFVPCGNALLATTILFTLVAAANSISSFFVETFWIGVETAVGVIVVTAVDGICIFGVLETVAFTVVPDITFGFFLIDFPKFRIFHIGKIFVSK